MDAQNEDFKSLAGELDGYLQAVQGCSQAAFAPYNDLALLNHVVLLTDQTRAVACGALKLHGEGQAELKRIFVTPEYRGRGLSSELLAHLEARAADCGCHTMLLETNPAFTAAVALYRRHGYTETAPFGPYASMCTLCMRKALV